MKLQFKRVSTEHHAENLLHCKRIDIVLLFTATVADDDIDDDVMVMVMMTFATSCQERHHHFTVAIDTLLLLLSLFSFAYNEIHNFESYCDNAQKRIMETTANQNTSVKKE